MKHSPGCNCCDCTIVSESFTVANGTAIEDVSGWFLADTDCVTLASLGTAAEVQSNVLETASSDMKAVVGIGGVVEDEWIVQSDVKGDDEGDELDVIAIADGANRCYLLVVRLTVSDTCPTLQIVYLENTVENPNTETILREIPLPDAAVGEWHRLKACVLDAPAEYPYGGYYNKRIFASVTTNIGTTRYVLADVLWLSDFGITGVGTGAITTKAYFDNFEMSRHQSDTSKSCPRCRLGACEYSTDDFANGIDCVWDQSSTVFDAPVTAHVSYTTMRGTRPASGVPFIRHKIGNPYNHALNSVEVYFLIENEGDTIGIAPIADETGPGPTVFFTAGAEDSDCGYLQMNSTSAVHLPVPAFGANVWVHARVCYGWNYWGTGKILSVVVNGSTRYSIEVDDYDTADYNAGIGGGPFWYSALSYAAGTAGNEVHFRDFAVSLSYSADPLLTGTYGYARECQKCYETIDTCLWAESLCVSTYEDCLIVDTGSWDCAESSCGFTRLLGATDSQRIWQLPNPFLVTSHRVEGIVSANGECDQTVMICYDQDSGDYIGLKFTWDNTCGSVAIVENGTPVATFESGEFVPGQAYQFCFIQAGGFATARIKKYDLGECDLSAGATSHIVALQSAVTVNTAGIWCGAKTGTWVDGGTSAGFYDLIFYTARSDDHPECEPCTICEVFTDNATDDASAKGCEWVGAAENKTILGSGESITATYKTLEEEDKTARVTVQFTTYGGEAVTLTLGGKYTLTVTQSSDAVTSDATIETSEGDSITGLDPFPIYENITLQICRQRDKLRFWLDVLGLSWSFLRAPTVAAWSDTIGLSNSGPGDVWFFNSLVAFASCTPCDSVCEACDSFVLPSLAVLEVSFDTGTECCDFFEGLFYIEMDGCSGTGDSVQTTCLFPAPTGARDIAGTWSVYLEQFVGYVRITAQLYAQYDYPLLGQTFFWRVNVPTIGDPSDSGVVNCLTLGRLTLNFDESTLYTNPCALDGISFYSGTQVYLELQ